MIPTFSEKICPTDFQSMVIMCVLFHCLILNIAEIVWATKYLQYEMLDDENKFSSRAHNSALHYPIFFLNICPAIFDPWGFHLSSPVVLSWKLYPPYVLLYEKHTLSLRAKFCYNLFVKSKTVSKLWYENYKSRNCLGWNKLRWNISASQKQWNARRLETSAKVKFHVSHGPL